MTDETPLGAPRDVADAPAAVDGDVTAIALDVGGAEADSETPSDAVAERPRRRVRRIVIEWALIVVVAIAVSFLMRAYVIQTFFIPSASMEPTLQIGDRIIVSKLSVELGSIHRGDIIVFKAPPAEHCGDAVSDLVKRVIGLPGDYIYSQGNTIYVNHHRFAEPWTHTEPLGTSIPRQTVPANTYYVMGDNHSDSCDSRFWGGVPRSDVIGKVFLRIWPLSRIGFL
ncbi:MAG: signal peptidase I [Acidimicrobiales bacterium]